MAGHSTSLADTSGTERPMTENFIRILSIFWVEILNCAILAPNFFVLKIFKKSATDRCHPAGEPGNTVGRGSITLIRCLIVLNFSKSTDDVMMLTVSSNTPWWPFE
jgi:hypothetical protein